MSKKRIKKEINSYFIPEQYYKRGITKKQLFKRNMLKVLKKERLK